jgi:PAS domain-containing protein
VPTLVLDSDLRITVANPAFYRVFGLKPEETESQLIYDLGGGRWNIPELRRLLEEIVPRNSRVDDFAIKQEVSHLGQRDLVLNARRVELQKGHPLILLAIEDITESRRNGAA